MRSKLYFFISAEQLKQEYIQESGLRSNYAITKTKNI